MTKKINICKNFAYIVEHISRQREFHQNQEKSIKNILSIGEHEVQKRNPLRESWKFFFFFQMQHLKTFWKSTMCKKSLNKYLYNGDTHITYKYIYNKTVIFILSLKRITNIYYSNVGKNRKIYGFNKRSNKCPSYHLFAAISHRKISKGRRMAYWKYP